MTPLDKLLARLRELEGKLPKGKWLNAYPNACKLSPMPDHVWTTEKELIAKDLVEAEAQFIAESRNALPVLLDIVARQKRALESIEDDPSAWINAKEAIAECDALAEKLK